jgi:hypothetical protein
LAWTPNDRCCSINLFDMAAIDKGTLATQPKLQDLLDVHDSISRYVAEMTRKKLVNRLRLISSQECRVFSLVASNFPMNSSNNRNGDKKEQQQPLSPTSIASSSMSARFSDMMQSLRERVDRTIYAIKIWYFENIEEEISYWYDCIIDDTIGNIHYCIYFGTRYLEDFIDAVASGFRTL